MQKSILESDYDVRIFKIVNGLESYGIHPVRAIDLQESRKLVFIGVNYKGVTVFKENGASHLFYW